MSPRRACKKDGNQDAIVDALQKCGMFVIDAHEFAQYQPGIADLVVFCPGGKAAFVEVKEIGGNLTKAERKFRQLCDANGVAYVILDTTDAAQIWAQAFRKDAA